MSSQVYNLLRVDIREIGNNRSVLSYVWKCDECGGEYTTSSLNHKTSIFCYSCRKARKIRARQAAKDKLKKEQLVAMKSLFKDILNVETSEEVIVSGEKYISKKALEKNFMNLLA